MLADQILLTSGRRIAKLAIKDIEQVGLWQLFQSLKQLECVEGDFFIPRSGPMRQHIAVLNEKLGAKQGLGLFKRLWATVRVGLSKLWCRLRGDAGLKQAFAAVETIGLPERATVTDALRALNSKSKPVVKQVEKLSWPNEPDLCEAIRKLPALYHPENVKRTGTIQHELGHCILQYLNDFPMAAITADSTLLKRLNQVAAGAVISPTKEITSRKDLIAEIFHLLGGFEATGHLFRRLGSTLSEKEPYLSFNIDFCWNAKSDFHEIQQVLLQHTNLLSESEKKALASLKVSRMKFNQKADDLSGEEALQMGAEMVTLMQHPLVRTIRNYAAAILHNLPTDRLERMTEDLGKRQTIVGNDEIRQFVETHLTLESLQRLKSEFISSLHSEQGALYDTLSKQDRPAGIPFCS